ncbi:MAG: response regulator transcription factor [Dehalococcoidia bacterium]|nr:response regulator transcription factor [Dehalococcoidia bacterium]
MKYSLLVAVEEPLFVDAAVNIIEASEDLFVAARSNERSDIIDRVGELQPNIAIIDTNLLEPAFFEAIEQIKRASPDTAILVVSSRSNPSCLIRCLKAGISGYVGKKTTAVELVSTIRSVCVGGTVLDGDRSALLLEYLRQVACTQGHLGNAKGLGRRELQALELAAEGLTNKEIASRLYISERTVQSHFGAIFHKLGVKSRTQAVFVALRQGRLADEIPVG